METKTKDGKYFSELGSWSHLVRIVILLIIFKVFGFIIGTIAIVLFWGVPVFLSKKEDNTN